MKLENHAPEPVEVSPSVEVLPSVSVLTTLHTLGSVVPSGTVPPSMSAMSLASGMSELREWSKLIFIVRLYFENIFKNQNGRKLTKTLILNFFKKPVL